MRPYSPRNPNTSNFLIRCWKSHLTDTLTNDSKKKTFIQSLVDNVYGWDYDGIWSSSIPQLSFLSNENIFVKCFRTSSSFRNPRISPLTIKYESPQLFLLINSTTYFPTQGKPSVDEPYQVGNNVYLIVSHAQSIQNRKRLFETFYFLQSNTWKSLSNRQQVPKYLLCITNWE